jgi:hypothetical protein
MTVLPRERSNRAGGASAAKAPRRQMTPEEVVDAQIDEACV